MALASKGRGRDEDSGVLRGNWSVDVGQRPATGTRLFLRRNFCIVSVMKAQIPRPWKWQSFSNALHSQSW